MKVVYIMRGISGSGKSTVAASLAHTYHASLCSTDNFFMVDGKYQFDISLLGAFHKRCFDYYSVLVESGVFCVILDNTNCKRKEFQKYVDKAKYNGYEIIEVVVGFPWKTVTEANGQKSRVLDEEFIKKCVARNTHNVPLDVVMQQARNFEI